MITVVSVIDDCRDEKDNKFLALAIDSDATLIVTGDDDLLALNAFRGVNSRCRIVPRALLWRRSGWLSRCLTRSAFVR